MVSIMSNAVSMMHERIINGSNTIDQLTFKDAEGNIITAVIPHTEWIKHFPNNEG